MRLDNIETHRRWPIRTIDRSHIEALLQHKHNTQQDYFSPLLVWKDVDGLVYVLDGMHRLLTYHREGKHSSVPVTLIDCSPEEALLASSAASSRPVKSSNGIERQDLAWLLVRAEYSYTAKQISQASGVSIRQVKYMRARLREFETELINPTGEWWRDRSDDMSDSSNGGFSSMTQTETARAVKSGIKDLKSFINDKSHDNPAFKSDEGLARLLIGSLGDERLKRIFSAYFGRDYEISNILYSEDDLSCSYEKIEARLDFE